MSRAGGLQCATCAEPLLPNDQFCGGCGASVSGISGASARSNAQSPRRTARLVLMGVAGFIAVAVVSGLVVAVIDARRDVRIERDRLETSQAMIVELTNDLDATVDPDVGLQGQLATVQADLAETQSQLAQAVSDLTVERDARAADASAATTQNAAAVAAVQVQLDAALAQLASLQALFPLDENTYRAAALSGDYVVTIQPVECTIVACLDLKSLSLSFPDASKVSGNRANGIISFQDGSYVISGELASEQSPLCNGIATDATFDLSYHASRVEVVNGVLGATAAVGAYRETIVGGECDGQFRSYSLTLAKE